MSDGNETNGSAPAGEETAEAAGTPHVPHIQILRGRPTPAEVAALITVLGSAVGGGAQPEQPESTRWGLPVDKLRYAISNYQRITLQERIHMQR
ncbi:acyl-CoA carboxylase subunit epsilon [Mycobacterium sp. 050128]|uniref:acyl-CoA carboxylase subunit epsilon n=1 Tax=Mycobacterium sp. 050128 TaxID=3096112 RepID=UPI002EDABD67